MSKLPAAQHLQRILSLIPLISAEPGITVGELAKRLGVSEQEVFDDLEFLPFCGLPPYSPDRLIEVQILGDSVTVRFAEYFQRPLQLSSEEGFALLAAGRAMSASAGKPQHLESALEKLEQVLGPTEGLSVTLDQPALVEQIEKAVRNYEQVHISYYSFGRNVLTERDIDPTDVFYAFGQWYVRGYCHLAGGERVFRVDRIHRLEVTSKHFTSTESSGERALFTATPAMPRVTLDLDPQSRWLLDLYEPETTEERTNGKIRATFAVANESRFLRILLRLGPHASVVKPAEWKRRRASSAKALLERYRKDAETFEAQN